MRLTIPDIDPKIGWTEQQWKMDLNHLDVVTSGNKTRLSIDVSWSGATDYSTFILLFESMINNALRIMNDNGISINKGETYEVVIETAELYGYPSTFLFYIGPDQKLKDVITSQADLDTAIDRASKLVTEM